MRLSHKNLQRKTFAIKNSKTLAFTLHILKYLSQAGIHKWAPTDSLPFFHCLFSWGHRQGDCNRIVPSKPTKFRLYHLQELSKSKHIRRLKQYKICVLLSLRSHSTTWKPIFKLKTLPQSKLMKTDGRHGEQKFKDLKLSRTCRVLTFTQKTQHFL